MSLTVGLTVALSLLGAVAAVPAGATITRNEVGAFGGYPEVSFEYLTSAAVDNSAGPSNGDLYTTGGLFEEQAVFKFHASGVYAGVEISGSETPQGSFAFLGFGPPPEEGVVFPEIAVDGSTGENSGDVYVPDIGHGVVDKFNENGQYLCQITGSESPSLSECNGVAGSNTPAGSMEPRGVAIAENGDVYVSDVEHDVIDVFGSKGEYLTQYADPDPEPGSLAFNAAGDLYIANGNFDSVLEETAPGIVELAPDGSVLADGELGSTQALSLAVDRATGDVAASTVHGVSEFEGSGTKLGSFGAGREQRQAVHIALAIDEAANEVYTNEYIYSPMTIWSKPAIAPNEAKTGAAGEVGEEVATLHGHVVPDSRPGGEITECFFEYGLTAAYGEKIACEQPVPDPAGGEVTAKPKLSPSSIYHFRLVAKDAGSPPLVSGSTYGADETLTTSGPAGIESEESTAYAKNASLRAEVNPYGFATSCQLQYVDEAKFKQTGYAEATSLPCSPAELEAAVTAKSVSAQLVGLSVGTTYHYRFVTTNGSKAKTTDGAEETFATFGIKSFSVEDLGPGGEVKYTAGEGGYRRYFGPADTQAGSHPYALEITFQFNTTNLADGGRKGEAGADPKDIITELPPGLIGNATVLPRCTPGQLQDEECSGATQVGVLSVLQEEHIAGLGEDGLYNIVPPAGTPVEFGANIAKDTMVFITANVRTGGDYGVTSVVKNASTNVGVTGAHVELWGVPAEASHDELRQCATPQGERGPCSAGIEPKPFLSNATSCAGEQTAKLRIDAWQAPGEFTEETTTMPPVTGCGALSFSPSISVLPDTAAADSPSGVSIKLHVPQNESAEGLMAPSLRNAVVVLPEGVTLNPASANGLASCSEAQFGLHNDNQPECPNASKVGSIEIETPLVAEKLVGSAYLAEENKNPFNSTFALYVAAQGDGSMVKVAGKVEPNPLTGQLTSSFVENPDVPFSDFRLHFFGGPRAPLATPKVCGTYTTTSILTPWSAPESGLPAEPTIPFDITAGPDGAPCATPGFSPSFTAGTTNVQAGAFSQFTLTMGRNDGEQNLGTIKTALPIGLTGELTGVPLCGEEQANDGDCPAASQIGHVVTGVGAGPFPLFVPGPGTPEDPVYLTGPYKGAPFGLSVVVPAEAGPFNLDENGRPVVVRAKVNLDPVTSQVMVESDPLPQILKGVPLDIRDVNVVIDRPNFLINPTSCNPTQIGAQLTSALGLSAERSVPFQVTDCAALGFSPQFAVSTSGTPSRADGVTLHVKLTEPPGSFGKNANIRKVKVELPKQLPSRLTTLQKACTEATFTANPANCPAASRVGYATASTPIVPVPLTGTAYFVSNGGAKFPELIIVLQGYGITVDLHGETFISKAGITSSTFNAVPDEPIGSFELTLPQGPYSALTGHGNLCGANLEMPTEFVGQNGTGINESIKITTTGCKPAIRVVKHRTKGKKATIVVHVPSGGTLTARAGGELMAAAERTTKAGDVPLVLTLSRSGRDFLARHPGRQFASHVELTFTTVQGKRLTTSVTLLLG